MKKTRFYRTPAQEARTLREQKGVAQANIQSTSAPEKPISPEEQIEQCTQLIRAANKRRLSKDVLVSSYLLRANAYYQLKEYDKAKKDCDTVILQKQNNNQDVTAELLTRMQIIRSAIFLEIDKKNPDAKRIIELVDRAVQDYEKTKGKKLIPDFELLRRDMFIQITTVKIVFGELKSLDRECFLQYSQRLFAAESPDYEKIVSWCRKGLIIYKTAIQIQLDLAKAYFLQKEYLLLNQVAHVIYVSFESTPCILSQVQFMQLYATVESDFELLSNQLNATEQFNYVKSQLEQTFEYLSLLDPRELPFYNKLFFYISNWLQDRAKQLEIDYQPSSFPKSNHASSVLTVVTENNLAANVISAEGKSEANDASVFLTAVPENNLPAKVNSVDEKSEAGENDGKKSEQKAFESRNLFVDDIPAKPTAAAMPLENVLGKEVTGVQQQNFECKRACFTGEFYFASRIILNDAVTSDLFDALDQAEKTGKAIRAKNNKIAMEEDSDLFTALKAAEETGRQFSKFLITNPKNSAIAAKNNTVSADGPPPFRLK